MFSTINYINVLNDLTTTVATGKPHNSEKVVTFLYPLIWFHSNATCDTVPLRKNVKNIRRAYL